MKKFYLKSWLPSTIALVYIAFLTLFALDVFIPGKTYWYYLQALFIHLIPQFILLVILSVAWRCQKIGGIFFITAFAAFMIFFEGRTYFWSQALLFSPLLLIGFLFLLKDQKGGKDGSKSLN